MNKKKPSFERSAYGGGTWSPRATPHRDEIGRIWEGYALDSEWGRLQAVLLHPPGPELTAHPDPDSIQMLDLPDWKRARQQHDALAEAYRRHQVAVHYVQPDGTPAPNQIFCADLFFMTPEGAILARPASTVRAGEERWVARRLADIGIPILKTLRGTAVFEGADAHWIDEHTVLIARGLRTNDEAITQIGKLLAEMGVSLITVDLPIGTMHLMGILRFLDRDLALAWPYRLGWQAVNALRERGIQVLFIPDETEASQNGALNFITLGPREILMAAANPVTQGFLESHGVTCHTLEVDELLKAAGGIGCLTGVLKRQLANPANNTSDR